MTVLSGPPRALPRVLLSVLLGVLYLFLAPATSFAQVVDLNDFGPCVTGAVSGVRPSTEPGDLRQYMNPTEPLTVVWACSADLAGNVLVPIGLQLLGAFALIALVWLGLNFMFSGSLELGQFLSTIFLIGFAFAILNHYYANPAVDTPWGMSRGFPMMIGEQAVEISSRIMGTAADDFAQAFVDADDRLEERQNQSSAAGQADVEDQFRQILEDDDAPETERAGALTRYFTSLSRRVLIWLFSVSGQILLWIIGWLLYAQYLWGFFALSVLTMVGPLFVPFVVLAQFDFLFWGWFKALLQSAVYMITASVLYVVTAAILLAPVQRLAFMPFPDEAGGLLAPFEYMARLYFEYVPLVLMTFFGALKVGSLAGGFMSGGTPPGSGLGSFGRSAANALGSPRAAAIADRAHRFLGTGGTAPSTVMSQRTAAGGAARDASRRVRSREPVQGDLF